jgi:hypothetical protein
MPTCFVVQGFGKKTDFESGRVLDLDSSYEVIKEAVEAAGYDCVRADEIQQSGHIERAMYEQLFAADLVIADLSTSNVNAFFELGVRYALRPYTTIVIAEDQINFPFDVNHIPIRTYKHLGDDIGRKEAIRFANDLTALIQAIDGNVPKSDSPVFTFLPTIEPPAQGDVRGVDVGSSADEYSGRSLNDLKAGAKEAMLASAFGRAIPLWSEVREQGPKDDYVVQQLALATYKAEQPSKVAALKAAKEILEALWPCESLDPETLGLWAAVNKRLYDADADPSALDMAITATEKGWVLRKDYYNGINLAFLLDTRAAGSPVDRAREDHARAQGVRREVVQICKDMIDGGEMTADKMYWVLATLQEATAGLGDTEATKGWESAASQFATAAWMSKTTADQIAKLRVLQERIQRKLGS